jgi:cell division protein FtsW
VNERPRRSSARPTLTNNVRGKARAVASTVGRQHKPDYWIVVLSALLLTIGLVVVYSISPGLAASQHISQNYFIAKQLIAVGLGIVTFLVASYIPLSVWRKLAVPLVVAALAGCLIVMLTPINAQYPAHRWIRVGSFSFQVAELIKLALLVWLATFLTKNWKEGKLANFNAVLKPLLILLLALGFVMTKLQSDLGSAGVIIAMMAIMAYAVGVPLKRISLIAALVVVLVGLAIASSGYRRERLSTFLHPESNCQTTGYQECQALIAVGSGGIFGLGLGYSVQAYGYLPEASNDSIFAIMAEKFGFVGTVGIVVIYAVFLARLKHIIERTADQFSRLLVVGVMAWLSTQMIINIGAMLGLLPLKGITLPLISQGGTSLIFITAALGLVFQVSRYTSYNATEPENIAQSAQDTRYSFDGGRVRRPHNPSLVARPRT